MRKLYRSRNNRMLSGLCGGFGENYNIDVTLVRILCVVLTFFSSGGFILVYFIISLVVPKSPDIYNPFHNGGFNGPGGHGGYNGGPGGSGGFGGFGGQGGQGGFGGHPNQFNRPDQSQYSSQRQWQPPQQQPTNDVDSMMNDLEKKALRNEIEQLKKKLNEVEKKGE